MKLRDIIEAERYFSHRKDEPHRKKDRPTIKDYLKFVKEIEEFQKFMKEKEKKEEKKEHKGLLPNDWSVGKKMTFFAMFGPPLGIGYVFGLVIMVRVLARFITG